jgi:hypothetical protein
MFKMANKSRRTETNNLIFAVFLTPSDLNEYSLYLNVRTDQKRTIKLYRMRPFIHDSKRQLVVLNKLVKTFGKKSNLKFGLIQTQQLCQVLKHFAKSLTFCID